MKKVLIVMLAMCLLVFTFAGCADNSKVDASEEPAPETSAPETTESETTESETPVAEAPTEEVVIGFSHITLSNEFMVLLQKGIQEKCDELGVTLIANNPEMDIEKQIQQVESFIAQGVNAIIMDPVDSEASAPCIEKANAAGIPIICVNSITASEPDAFVGSNDEEAAEIAINYIADKLSGTGTIFMIHGNPGQSAEVKRSDGAYNTLKNFPELKLEAEDTAHWSREEAMQLTENWIQSYGDEISAIFAQNDEMAMGALMALENTDTKENIILIGVDAIPDALQAVKDGRLDATVFQDAYGQGAGAVEVAMKLIAGETVEAQGFIPFQLVTSDNVDEFLS